MPRSIPKALPNYLLKAQIKDNPVVEYLHNNPGDKLSIKTLYNKLNLKRKTIYYYAVNSKNIRQINPIEVGSNKYKLNVFTYNN